jgi:pyridoxal phosphate enzyme (YggS family)
MTTGPSIRDNLRIVRETIAEAASKAGRSAGEITLVGITKTVPAAGIQEVIEEGLLEIGENRVQEAEGKIRGLDAALEGSGRRVRWHMVGHLQRNKAKTAIGLFDVIQSVDSRRIAEAVSRAAEEAGEIVDVLVEVNTSGEATKYGLNPAETVKFVADLADLKGLRMQGLMTVGPLVSDPRRARPAFSRLRELGAAVEAEGFPWARVRYLSMGMTADMREAIEEGSNMVRVGTAIFGRRAQG